jgi:hypothetical protein
VTRTLLQVRCGADGFQFLKPKLAMAASMVKARVRDSKDEYSARDILDDRKLVEMRNGLLVSVDDEAMVLRPVRRADSRISGALDRGWKDGSASVRATRRITCASMSYSRHSTTRL